MGGSAIVRKVSVALRDFVHECVELGELLQTGCAEVPPGRLIVQSHAMPLRGFRAIDRTHRPTVYFATRRVSFSVIASDVKIYRTSRYLAERGCIFPC